MSVKSFLIKSAPTILSITASIGVAATAILSVKVTPDALNKVRADSMKKHDGDPDAYTKKEAIKSAWKFYIPAVGVGFTTIACIFGANCLSRKQQSALIAGYSLIRNNFKEYQDKLKELYGNEAHERIEEEIAKEHCHFEGITAYDFCGSSSLGIETDQPEPLRTFYESFSKRYFDSTLSNVIQAEYHFNRNYCLGFVSCINDFYEFLGIPKIDCGDHIGFAAEDGISWIDFNHRVTTLDDGMEIVVIDMSFIPSDISEYIE